MQKLSDEFYQTAIKSVFHDAVEIRAPVVPGIVAKVFIFQTKNGPRVCRFNEKTLVERNQKLTKILYDYGTPVKLIKAHEYKGQYFESYEFDPHQTLKEALPDMSETEIIDTYKSVLRIQANLVRFPIEKFSQIDNAHFMDVYKITMPQYINNGLLRYLYRTIYKHFSVGKNTCVAHNDLTPANMLVSDDHHNIVRLIDIDSISICNENMAIFSMLRFYPLSNFKEIIEYYQDISGHKLNSHEIMYMSKLFRETAYFRNRLNNFTFRNITNQH